MHSQLNYLENDFKGTHRLDTQLLSVVISEIIAVSFCVVSLSKSIYVAWSALMLQYYKLGWLYLKTTQGITVIHWLFQLKHASYSFITAIWFWHLWSLPDSHNSFIKSGVKTTLSVNATRFLVKIPQVCWCSWCI